MLSQRNVKIIVAFVFAAAIISTIIAIYSPVAPIVSNHPLPKTNATIIVAKGADAVIDSGISFHPVITRSVIGINNTVTWINKNDTSIILDSGHAGFLVDNHFNNVTIYPNESFSFTYTTTGIYHYREKNVGKDGAVLISTEEFEAARLIPARNSILQKSPEEMAKIVIRAADPDDDIASVRLNNTRMMAFTTHKDADIIVPSLSCMSCGRTSFEVIFYRSPLGKPIIHPSKDVDLMMDFAKNFMQEIGYEMDGSERIDTVDLGERVEISFYQRIRGEWIVQTHGAHFTFYDDWTWITLPIWYENRSIANYKFGLGTDEAEKVALDYMNRQVSTDIMLKKYKYELLWTGVVQVEIIDDKVMYMIPASYRTTDPEYLDERDHCSRPAHQTFEVLIEASTGKSFDWRLSPCA